MRLFILLLVVFGTPLLAQKPPLRKYWVSFSDKTHTPYCTCRPAEFLSARSLARRQRAQVPVLEEDLPVDPAYLKALRATGVQVHSTSRWLNAAAIIADTNTVKLVRKLPFVRQVEYIGKHIDRKSVV